MKKVLTLTLLTTIFASAATVHYDRPPEKKAVVHYDKRKSEANTLTRPNAPTKSLYGEK